MRFVTEPLFSNLLHMIELNSSSVGSSAIEGFELDELAIQKGLLQVSEALDFLHNTANSVHLDIQPSSVLINSKGDWKLFGLGFVETYTKDANNEYFTPRFDPRLPSYIQVNYDYAAPELVLDRKLDPANDIFSLGCLLIALFLHRAPMRTDNNPSIYKQEFQNVNRLLNDSRIPSYLHDILPQMLARYPTNRITLNELKSSPLFDNILIRTINFLDDFPAKLPAEQQAFMTGFSKLIDQFPKSVLQKKILPAFLEELGKEETLTSPILANIFIIGKDMSQLGFSEKILPAIRKVKDNLGAKVTILNNVEVLTSRVKGDNFRDDILPILLDTVENAPPEIQEVALAKVPIFIEKLDFLTLKNEVFPVIGSVFAKTTSLAVKIEALEAFEHLVKSGLDKYAVTEKLLPLLSSMKTREPTVMMGALRVYSKIVPVIEVEILARQVIPQLLNMSMESMLNHNQFRSFMEEIHKVLDRVEKEHGKRLSQVQVNTNGSIGGSNRLDDSNGADGEGNGPLNFEDLVYGKNKKTESTQSTPVLEKALPVTSSNKPLGLTSSSTVPTSSFGALKLEPSASKPYVPSPRPEPSFAPVRKLSPPPISPPAKHASLSSNTPSSSISWNTPSTIKPPSVGGFGSTGAGGFSPMTPLSTTSQSSSRNNGTLSPSGSSIDWGRTTTVPTISPAPATVPTPVTAPTLSPSSTTTSSGIDWSRAVKPKPSINMITPMTPQNRQSSTNNDSFGEFHATPAPAQNNGGFGIQSLQPMKPMNSPLGFSLTPLSASKPGGISGSNNTQLQSSFGDDSLI